MLDSIESVVVLVSKAVRELGLPMGGRLTKIQLVEDYYADIPVLGEGVGQIKPRWIVELTQPDTQIFNFELESAKFKDIYEALNFVKSELQRQIEERKQQN